MIEIKSKRCIECPMHDIEYNSCDLNDEKFSLEEDVMKSFPIWCPLFRDDILIKMNKEN